MHPQLVAKTHIPRVVEVDIWQSSLRNFAVVRLRPRVASYRCQSGPAALLINAMQLATPQSSTLDCRRLHVLKPNVVLDLSIAPIRILPVLRRANAQETSVMSFLPGMIPDILPAQTSPVFLADELIVFQMSFIFGHIVKGCIAVGALPACPSGTLNKTS